MGGLPEPIRVRHPSTDRTAVKSFPSPSPFFFLFWWEINTTFLNKKIARGLGLTSAGMFRRRGICKVSKFAHVTRHLNSGGLLLSLSHRGGPVQVVAACDRSENAHLGARKGTGATGKALAWKSKSRGAASYLVILQATIRGTAEFVQARKEDVIVIHDGDVPLLHRAWKQRVNQNFSPDCAGSNKHATRNMCARIMPSWPSRSQQCAGHRNVG
jgi:hypothetical protein